MAGNSADIATLTALIEPEVQALGFELVRVKIMPSEAGDGGQALQIMAEDPATGQLVIDQCAAISRRVSEQFDAAEEQGNILIEDAYHLEVSSPGIDRPLTREKDFAQWAGHEAKISVTEKLDGQRNFRGILIGLDTRNGKAAAGIEQADGDTVLIPLDIMHSAKLVLTDALIAATAPLDTGDAEIETETEEQIEEQED
ncbi:MAG: ribosome maturation protein RimP [Pseudomonadota bacterium]